MRWKSSIELTISACGNTKLTVLFPQDLQIVLENDKSDNMMEAEWRKVNRLAFEKARICLAKDQMSFVMRRIIISDLWQKLEEKYMIKSIENYLHLKRKLFPLQHKLDTSIPKVTHQ